MIPGDDSDPSGNPAERMLRDVMGISTASIAAQRATELATLSLKCAQAGISFSFICPMKDERNPESKARAIVVALCGNVPDDLMQMIEDYCRGAAQDFVSNDPNLRLLYKNDHKPDNPAT